MHLGDHPGVVLAQRAAPVDQHSQHRELLVVDYRAQPGHPGADQGDGVRVGGIGLAALPGGEHPGSGGQLRRDVDDVSPSLSSRCATCAHAVAALDRPDPLRPLPKRQHS